MNAMLPRLDYIEIQKALAAQSLSDFVRMAWHVLEPGTPYVHGWHVDAICEHLTAVTHGEITRLLINVPPGTMKSTLCSVFHRAWEWGPCGLPHKRYIGASHEQNLAIRDNVKLRRLIESDWYQERWPIPMLMDQNQKIYFENSYTGFSQACAVESMTGRRGDTVIWDDPHSVEAALSPAKRETGLRVFQETLPTRLNSPKKSAIVIVMQRLHENDVAGYILENDLGYEHLCLPMEFEVERRCRTSIGFVDPRTEEGELLFPERFPREVVDRDKRVMGALAVAGQFQQRPAPRAGGFFEWENIRIVKAAPPLINCVRYWDKAGTDGGGAWTAGVKIGLTQEGRIIVLDVVRGQWAAGKREKAIKTTAALDGPDLPIWIEQEPGSGGKESAESTIKNLVGYNIRAERPTGDKEVRAEPVAVQIEAGNFDILEGPWNQAYLDELKTFPQGKYKDQVDATSGGLAKVANVGFIGVLA